MNMRRPGSDLDKTRRSGAQRMDPAEMRCEGDLNGRGLTSCSRQELEQRIPARVGEYRPEDASGAQAERAERETCREGVRELGERGGVKPEAVVLEVGEREDERGRAHEREAVCTDGTRDQPPCGDRSARTTSTRWSLLAPAGATAIVRMASRARRLWPPPWR